MTEYIPLHLHPLRCHLWPAENKMARMKQRWKPTVGSVRSAHLKMTPNRPNPRRSKVEAKVEVKAKVEAKVRVFQMDHPQQRRAQWNDLPLAVGLWPLRRWRLPPKPHPSPGLLKPRRLPSPNPERKPRSRKRVNQRKRELGGGDGFQPRRGYLCWNSKPSAKSSMKTSQGGSKRSLHFSPPFSSCASKRSVPSMPMTHPMLTMWHVQSVKLRNSYPRKMSVTALTMMYFIFL